MLNKCINIGDIVQHRASKQRAVLLAKDCDRGNYLYKISYDFGQVIWVNEEEVEDYIEPTPKCRYCGKVHNCGRS